MFSTALGLGNISAFLEAVFCSTSHPYAFHNGSHCCATQEDNEGGKLTIHSTTCKGMKVEECASVTCKDNDLSIGNCKQKDNAKISNL